MQGRHGPVGCLDTIACRPLFGARKFASWLNIHLIPCPRACEAQSAHIVIFATFISAL